jgi:hypothetical protein
VFVISFIWNNFLFRMIDFWIFNSISSSMKIQIKNIIIISPKINILFINNVGIIIMNFRDI